MKLICPGCGAVASAESWDNDLTARAAIQVVSRMPAPVNKQLFSCISLFRPEKRSLSWKKTLRLLGEVEQLVSKGYVGLQGKVDKNCPPSLWAKAMEQMTEQRSCLRLPMNGHNYLRKVAWDLADQADYSQEKKKKVPVNRNESRSGDPSDLDVYDPDKIREQYYKRMDVDRGESSSLPNMSNIVKDID